MFRCTALIVLLAVAVAGQTAPPSDRSLLDPGVWGVIYDVPATKRVTVKRDIIYFTSPAGAQTVDIYSPPDAKGGVKLPAVIFLNAIGDRPGDQVKNWGIYSSWPRLVAAQGMVGISMDADGERIQDSLKAVFDFLVRDGAKHGIDADRLGVYAASANTTGSWTYLMSESVHKGIRAAAMFYGSAPPAGPLRRDLAVLCILAEGDLAGFGQNLVPVWQRVAESRAPWTMVFASRMPHAFDAFEDNDESRRLVMQALAFWKTQLEPVPQPGWTPSAARAIVSATYGNDNQRTADLLIKYTADNPNDAQGFILLGRSLQQLRRTDEAVAAFERSLALKSDDMRAHGGLGQIRLTQQKYDDAARHLSRAIELGFRNSLMYGQLAFAQLALNQNEAALRSYEGAFATGIPPGANTRGVAYFNMATAYTRLKQTDKAFEVLGKAVAEGFNSRASYENDADLAPLRLDPRFASLLKRLSP
ncbi:MAG: tetratricopeptide repeat protein [Pyrinomonadaceae bacterium]